MADRSGQFNLRLPDGWRDAIKARAVRNHRSMNSEILAALESVVGEAATGEGLGNQAPAAAGHTAALPGGSIATSELELPK